MRSFKQILVLKTPLHETQKKNNIQIFPNPTNDLLQILSHEEPLKSISLRDMQGRLVQQRYINRRNLVLDISSIPSGIYIIEIFCKSGVVRKKIMKGK